ncbi:MAG: hypothetical protein ACYCQJ_10960 [Nitrososphaerales archaeon]
MQESSSSLKQEQPNNRLGPLKPVLGLILLDLAIQFVLGMYLNLFGIFPSQISSGGMMSAMMGGSMPTMSALMVHMLNGYVLGVLSLVVLGFSVYTKKMRLIVISIVGIAFISLAGISGLAFMFSAFSDNLLSFTMALGFIGGFAAYFFEVYSLR